MKVLAGIQHSSFRLQRHHYSVFSFLKVTLKHLLSYKLIRSISVCLSHDEVSGLSTCVVRGVWCVGPRREVFPKRHTIVVTQILPPGNRFQSNMPGAAFRLPRCHTCQLPAVRKALL